MLQFIMVLTTNEHNLAVPRHVTSYLLGQSAWSHDLSSTVSPEHALPPCCGIVFVHERVRGTCSGPQVCLHFDHDFHSAQTPLTKFEGTVNYNFRTTLPVRKNTYQGTVCDRMIWSLFHFLYSRARHELSRDLYRHVFGRQSLRHSFSDMGSGAK